MPTTTKGKKPASRTGAKQTSKAPAAKSSTRATKERKPKPVGASDKSKKKKRRTYTEKELDIPKLNMITPAGVKKPKGKKKGKVFIDDQESMMTILAMVNADKEGQIESKVAKARQMEEIRQARQKEMEARQEQRRSKIEDTKNSLRRPRKRNSDEPSSGDPSQGLELAPAKSKSTKKRVTFE